MPLISPHESILVLSALVLILTYHGYLYCRVRRHPLQTAIGITNHARQMWVEGVMQNQRDILAVQTMRNQVMAASLLASTAILLSLGSLNSAFRPEMFTEVSHALSWSGPRTEGLWMFKLMLLGILFFLTFRNLEESCISFIFEVQEKNLPEVYNHILRINF